ncbi:hypothetical protein BCR41DRAFT_50421 [Lobosporangium transversale]|uniref:Uncharacterized protein n=1 Tax=Lobosporangium transversale TaxID=64571 RepID=A0A1Y2GPD1_9FUNG|nr:hypothetical protein BCR41DRAFT_50421 [Lobosporangium transversale]ORZ17560.1 hypothetical protein BCR41DRAFT_50421 [Lobosporangium transversale]|eukprot:XP_021881947.1 hypothetical protein BCR41DRAFT_50421 [Lobosporangium transversale]
MIDMLNETSLQPESRLNFSSLKDVKVGEEVEIRSLGRSPKFFGLASQNLLVTEQMMELWEAMTESKFPFTKCLSGPMGVGKSYITWFLAAKAYAHGWQVLYIPDAKNFSVCRAEDDASAIICQIFLDLNKDILTAEELSIMANLESSGSLISTIARHIICLFQRGRQKTLFIVDEHGSLFYGDKAATDRFPVLSNLDSFNTWLTNGGGVCVVFTGTAHGKFERTILRDPDEYLVYVEPLSQDTFEKLFKITIAPFDLTSQKSLMSRMNAIIGIINRVPRDLVRFAKSIMLIKGGQLTVEQIDDGLEAYDRKCFDSYSNEISAHLNKLEGIWKEITIQALTKMFLPGRQGSQPGTFGWEFLDTGMVYRSTNERNVPEYRPINYPAQRAILNLYRVIPLPDSLRSVLASGNFDGSQFQEALFRELIRGYSHTFESTDLAGGNKMDTIFNISGYELLGKPPRMLGTVEEDGKRILINGGSYARFDFILGYMFIQVSVSSFTVHNDPNRSACIDRAFWKRKTTGKNQIEEYLDVAFGGVHQATMTEEPADDKNDNITSNNKGKSNRGRGNNQSDGKGTNNGVKKRKKGNDEGSDNKNGEGSSKKRKTVKKFAVTRDGKPCNDFQIVYICGGNKADKNAEPPNHTGKVTEYPQVRHICYDELKSKLFRAYMS